MIVIGNEILSGKITDSEHADSLLASCGGMGVSLERIVVIPDVIAVIAATVRAAAGDSTWCSPPAASALPTTT